MKNTSAANISRETAIHLPASPLSKTESTLWCSVFSVVSFLIVIGNLFTIILFKSNKRFRKRSLLFVINMAFSDLILGTFALPMAIYITISMKNYQHWMGNVDSLWTVPYFCITIYEFSLMVSLNFAVLISCERIYAIYRPFKHRTITVRTYYIFIFMVWSLSLLFDTSYVYLWSHRNFIGYVRSSYAIVVVIITCAFNIAIWRKIKHRRVASQQQNKATQNVRLTKTLMFASILALVCWVPLLFVSGLRYLGIIMSIRYSFLALFLNCSNAIINPVMYALRIPELRQAVVQCCVKKRERITSADIEIESIKAVILSREETQETNQLRKCDTDSNCLQLKFDTIAMNTKL